jgi:hypothetical protein
MKALPSATVIEPRMLGGFQTLFRRIDERVSDVLEAGVERGAFFQRVTLLRPVRLKPGVCAGQSTNALRTTTSRDRCI